MDRVQYCPLLLSERDQISRRGRVSRCCCMPDPCTRTGAFDLAEALTASVTRRRPIRLLHKGLSSPWNPLLAPPSLTYYSATSCTSTSVSCH